MVSAADAFDILYLYRLLLSRRWSSPAGIPFKRDDRVMPQTAPRLMTPHHGQIGRGFTNDVLLVLVGGGIGSACRYLISSSANRLFGDSFAWGTLAVNLIGCLTIGFLVGLVDRSLLSRTYRMLLVTGFLGGFTTFSSLSLDSIRMIASGYWDKGLLNIGINVVLGMVLTFVGLLSASRI